MPTSNVELGIKDEANIVNDDLSHRESLHGDRSLSEEPDNRSGMQITNIALFGLDRRDIDEASRSDCIMILSVSEIDKTIKLSSIMRDTYVNVYGHGMTKITHAYAYGGPVLAVRTLNENFNLDIKDFITVDFFELEKLIDLLGGVTVDISQDEIEAINECIKEASQIEKKPAVFIVSPGIKNLSGMQAVAYCRVRHTTGDDYKRTERQRYVMQCILEKLFKADVKSYPKIISDFLSYVETSLDGSRILRLGLSVYSQGINNIEKQRFPTDNNSRGEMIDGSWYLVTDLKSTAAQINEFIYKDIKP